MVRKRTRKTYESDENDSDSDLDFNVAPPSDGPAPKKYSLRERRSTSAFTSDFDYYGLDEDDGEERRGSTDDEDFKIDPEEEAQLLKNDLPQDVTVSTYLEEPTTISADNPDGLIDFEDMIRADIVVNRNRIDYDNLIQKTEIKTTTNKRRGRKPKSYAEDDLSPLTPEPEQNNELEREDELYEPEAEEDDDDELDGDAKDLLQPEVSLSENEPIFEPTEAKLDENEDKENDEQVKDSPALSEVPESNVAEPPKIVDVPQPPPEPPQEEDDDVIVLGDVGQDVIVLDD